MIYKEHTRNQKRMYRIHKQEEKIQEQELIIASLQQRIDKAIEYIGNVLCNSKAQVRNDISGKEIDNLIEILEDKENE